MERRSKRTNPKQFIEDFRSQTATQHDQWIDDLTVELMEALVKAGNDLLVLETLLRLTHQPNEPLRNDRQDFMTVGDKLINRLATL